MALKPGQIEVVDCSRNAWALYPGQIGSIAKAYNGCIVELTEPILRESIVMQVGPITRLRLTHRQGEELRAKLAEFRGVAQLTFGERGQPDPPTEAQPVIEPRSDSDGSKYDTPGPPVVIQPADSSGSIWEEPTPEPEAGKEPEAPEAPEAPQRPKQPEPNVIPFSAKPNLTTAPITEWDVIDALEPVKGISDIRSRQIWGRYRERSLDVIRKSPERVAKEINGVSLKIARRAKEHLDNMMRE